jgi:anti-sigma-K factor RskA
MKPQFEEDACLYVLGRLEARDRAAFEARLLHDRRLAEYVRELESALTVQIHALPQYEPPAGMLKLIEIRIDHLPIGEPHVPARSATRMWASIARWGIAAVIALSVGTIAVRDLKHAPAVPARSFLIIVGLDPHKSTVVELPLDGRPHDADARFIQLASLAEQFWEKPEDLPVKLAFANQDGRGYALFDPGSNQGFIAIRHIPAVEHGKRYHLWAFDASSGTTREAGVLPLTDSTSGLYFFSIASTGGALLEHLDFYVTAEDNSEPQSTKPTGKVILGDRTI